MSSSVQHGNAAGPLPDSGYGFSIPDKNLADQAGFTIHRVIQLLNTLVEGRRFVRAGEWGIHTEFKLWESLWPAL